jgi:hypothetical protein
VPKRRLLITVISMLVVCIIQQDVKYHVPMCVMKMLDIINEVCIIFGFHKMRGIS